MVKRDEGELSDQEQRMVSAWLDQELTEAERDVIEAQLLEGDEVLRRELDGYRFVRSEFRSWFESSVGTESRKIDLWSAIEKQIKADEVAAQRRGAEWSLNDWFERMRESAQMYFRPLIIGGTAAAALAVFVTTKSATNSENAQLAENEALQIEQSDEVVPPTTLVANRESEPDILARAGFDQLRHDLPSRLPVPDALAVKLLSSPQLIVQNDIPGGLRTGDADIEWIKTEKPFKLVSTRKSQTPPIIWVRAR